MLLRLAADHVPARVCRQSAAEVMDSCYGQLRGRYCQYCTQLFQAGQQQAEWRLMEAALWAVE